MSGPLSGIRVVDFSRVLAGPLCARTLMDLGADVIKVEPPRQDLSRFAYPRTSGMSGYYAQQNAGKRNVCIDLNVPGALDVILKLCDEADVVVENFRAGTMKFLGLDYETLAARNSRLIYVSISGYGQLGPWASRMAYAPVIQAESGFTRNSLDHYGAALERSMTDSLSHADVYTGLQGAIAALAALNRRSLTGVGQHVDVPMAATMLATSERAHFDLNPEELNDEPPILGAADCPFFEGPNGEQIVLSASLVGSLTFPFFLKAMRRPDLASDVRFATATARKQNVADLHRIVQTWFYTFQGIAALDCQLDEAKIAMGVIRTASALTTSVWAEHWRAVERVPNRRGGEYILPGRPWRFSKDELTPPGSPAFRGEHNRDVLSSIGVSEEHVNSLFDAGALLIDSENLSQIN
ncbi:MAG TPA: CaiB/BaiF CoA-transferase family protein [Burkholderiales bacterium]